MAKAKARRTLPRAAPPPEPKRPIGKWLLYGVIGALLLAFVIFLAIPPENVPDGIPEGTEAVTVSDATHIEGPIDYGDVVPAGGPHNPIPLNCEIYTNEIPTENAVHSLEHGAVWITYQPGIGGGAIDTLAGIARTRSKVILSPVSAQSSPIMATAWGWRLELTDPGDVRLRQFVNAFEGAATAPEPGTACVGGIAPHGG